MNICLLVSAGKIVAVCEFVGVKLCLRHSYYPTIEVIRAESLGKSLSAVSGFWITGFPSHTLYRIMPTLEIKPVISFTP